MQACTSLKFKITGLNAYRLHLLVIHKYGHILDNNRNCPSHRLFVRSVDISVALNMPATYLLAYHLFRLLRCRHGPSDCCIDALSDRFRTKLQHHNMEKHQNVPIYESYP